MTKDRKRRELSSEELQDARRLAAAWIAYKQRNPGTTQDWLARASGIGTQGAVGQYLRGVIPLNLESLLAMCGQINVDPREISPRLTAPITALPNEKMASEDYSIAQDIKEFIDVYCEANGELRSMLMDSVRSIRRRGTASGGAAGRHKSARNEL